MTEKDVLKLFKKEKAFLSGHFLLSSGLHSPHYMQCALVLQKPWIAEKLCRLLAKKCGRLKPQVVIGPALGGIVVSYEIGRALKVRSVFAERLPAGKAGVDEILTLRRGFSLHKNERVLVVEDVVTTGRSTGEVIELVRQSGAKPVGVASLVDRSGQTPAFPGGFFSLLKVDIQTYASQECPLCREGNTALVKPGSRTKKE
ncbi:MAG: orotate phosphoribosyltransferase [Candidatus Omnitrophica bacterium]|nr:orotate phosphoribosyltransferase [Candidatus Omnitrophota bacterium]